MSQEINPNEIYCLRCLEKEPPILGLIIGSEDICTVCRNYAQYSHDRISGKILLNIQKLNKTILPEQSTFQQLLKQTLKDHLKLKIEDDDHSFDIEIWFDEELICSQYGVNVCERFDD